MRKKLFTFLFALMASVGMSWAMPTEFANCYDCQREPAFPTKSESCVLSGFSSPMVGNYSSIGPWKIEFVEYYNSSSTEYDFSVSYPAYEYEIDESQVEIYRLYQWQNGAYQPVAYGVLCAYANESNPVEHAALFVAEAHWGCYLTGEVHDGGSINITFDEDASTGFGDLHGGSTPAGKSITINESSHGSVVASSSSAAAGETITLTATPDDGYQLKSISGVYEAQATSSETLNATSETVNGNKFQAQATSRNNYGWRVYNPGTANTLTVSSKDGTTLIEKIELTSGWGNGRANNMLSVSAGTLSFNGTPATTVTINDINATSVTISGSGNNAAKTWCISSVKVYYEGTDEVELEISDTENANVKTFTMVDSEVTISAEFEPIPAPATPNSIVINGTPAVGDNSISLTYYFDPANVPGIGGYAPTLKVKCVEDGKYDEEWLSLSSISSGTQTINLNNLGSFQAGKSYEVCFAYYNGSWVDEMFQSFSFDAPTPTPAVVIGDPNNVSEVETFLTTYDGHTIDELIIDRPVLNNMYNTLCLPFDMNATQIAASSLNGVEIREFTGASVEGTTLNLSVGDPVNAVVAGRPYFVKFSAASQLDNLHFEDVTINNALLDNMAVTFDGVTFKGTFTPFMMPNGLNFQGGYLFLGQNNQLFWPSTDNPLKPFRAYFYVNVEASTPGNAPKYRGMPARIVEGKNVATGVENAQSANQSTKVIVNGQLIIIKNDVRYNAQGQIVK
jgi:hypothetical protein